MDINEILSSLTPEDMEQLKNVAASLMGSGQTESKKEQQQSQQNNIFNSDMLGNLGKISNAVSGDDQRTALLKALKPMLSEQRQQKADEAIKILKIIQLLPLLRESGLLNGLF
ncbi:MAG: hypothetical protein IKM66_03420 [Clostridia bacterium]|nr:hypothetical protein [Clostridia bacterium]